MSEIKGPWEQFAPTFSTRLREPKKPPRPSDGSIKAAQASWDGRPHPETGEMQHVMTHRFGSVEEAARAAEELKRAGAYTSPETTVAVLVDPEESGDKHVVRWRSGAKRGRK